MKIVGYLNRSGFFPSPAAVVVTDSEKTFLMYSDGTKDDFEEFNTRFDEIKLKFYKASADNLVYDENKIYFMFSPERIICESRQKLFLLLREELSREKNTEKQELLLQWMEINRSKIL